jgi:protein involved in sex pheromone biosynthesis
MALEGVNPDKQVQALAEPAPEDIAAAQEAFGQAMGGVVMSLAMNSVGSLQEQLAELDKEE